MTAGRESITPKPTTVQNDAVQNPIAGRPRQKTTRSSKKRKKTRTLTTKTATNVVVSQANFNQTIVLPPAIDELFGMTPDERIAEVKRVCERDEVEALTNFVAPLTNWMNDLDYVLENYSDVVEALEEHFNKPGRPTAKRAKWGDLSLDSETLRYIREEFGYTPETPISWAGVCQVFFKRSIRTMQRRKAYKAFLTSGEMTVQANNKSDRSPGARGSHRKKKNQIDEREHAEITEIAGLAVKWASENPDSDSARAIMQLAVDRAKRLGAAAPRLVTKSDAKWVITTPKALFEFLNTEYIDTLDDVFSPESEPEEFASKLCAFTSEIARAFHGEAVRVEITVRKDRA